MPRTLAVSLFLACGLPAFGAWSNVKEVVIDHDKVGSADLTNFPMLVSGTYSYLATVANGGTVTSSSGYDIIFAADSAGVTKLKFTRVAWNASTGAVQFRVKVPSVSHTSNTIIYLLSGNSTITTDQQEVAATWPSQFKAVYGMESTSAVDSTGNNNGTPTGANLSVVTGQVGSAVNQSSVSPGSYISLGPMSNIFNGTNTSLTISGWFNNADIVTELQDEPFGQPSWPSGSVIRINSGRQNSTSDVIQLMFGSGSGGGTLANQVAVSTTTFTVPTTTWYHVSMTLDLTTLTNSKIYVNGALQTPSFYEETGRPTTFTALGTNPALFLSNFNGTYRGSLDEIRFSNTAPSDSWVLAEYNNEASPSTFYYIRTPSPITSIKRDICASGCYYPLTPTGLQDALNDAATYQDTSGQCIPYIIEGTGSITGATNFTLPHKVCGQYVEVRSSLGAHFTPGQRYNPTSDDAYAFTISGASSNALFISHIDGTRYWRFRNVKLTTETGAAYSSLINWGQGFNSDVHAMPDHLEILQCGFIGRGVADAGAGVSSNGDYVRAVDSYFTSFSKGPDSQAFLTTYGTYTELRNSYFSAVTESVGLGGGTVVPPGYLPRFTYVVGSNITKEPWMNRTFGSGAPTKACFEGNWYHDNTANQDYLCSAVSGVWTLQGALLPYTTARVKNLFENKLALGMRVYGNSMGPMPAQSEQDPMFFQFNLVSQLSSPGCEIVYPLAPKPCDQPQPWTAISDISITANDFHHGISVMSMGGSGGGMGPCSTNPVTLPCFIHGHRQINFSNNLVRDISDERNYCISDGYCWAEAGVGGGSRGVLNFGGGQEDITIMHNTHASSTFSAVSGYAYHMGGVTSGATPGRESGMFAIESNILPLGFYQLEGGAGYYNGCALQAMLTPSTGALSLHTNLISLESPTPQSWGGVSLAPVVPGCTHAGWPTDHASIPSVASILDSNYKVTSASGYQGWAVDGRDPGADIDLVTYRTSHAIDGAPNPNLDYQIRSMIATAGQGMKIYFTAPSTAACTWELSTNGNSYASPVAVSSQTRTGRDGVAIWNAGTLSASTAYWARSTCAGLKLETRLNGARAYAITAP